MDRVEVIEDSSEDEITVLESVDRLPQKVKEEEMITIVDSPAMPSENDQKEDENTNNNARTRSSVTAKKVDKSPTRDSGSESPEVNNKGSSTKVKSDAASIKASIVVKPQASSSIESETSTTVEPEVSTVTPPDASTTINSEAPSKVNSESSEVLAVPSDDEIQLLDSDVPSASKIKKGRAGKFLKKGSRYSDDVEEDESEFEKEGLITKAMLREEEKIRRELELEEERNMKKLQQDMDKEKSFKRLLTLLNQSQLYSKYLNDKMVEQKEEVLRQEQLKEKKLSNKEMKAKENKKSSKVGTRSGGSPVKSRSGRQTKRQRTKSDQEINENQSQKRKKLEEMDLNNDSDIQPEEFSNGVSNGKSSNGDLLSDISERQPLLLSGGLMRDYQLEGFEWMKVLYENGISGILADEMGLGKTIQCISLIAHLVGQGLAGPYLIVAPLSTLPNWLAEFNRFAPKIWAILYHGSKEEREAIRKKFTKVTTILGRPIRPVILMSYDIAIRDAKFMRRYNWCYLIVDEGHRLKNFNCLLVRELKSYRAANRLLLTGTPLQNNLSELWSLLNFLLPEIFDNLTIFQSWFDVTAMTSGEADETIIAQEREKHIISTLHEILNPFLLRRTKADVELNLPPKKELMVYAPISELQEYFYKATLDKSILRIFEEKKSGKSADSDDNLLSRKRACVKQIDYTIFERDLTHDELVILDRTPDDFIDATIPLEQDSETKLPAALAEYKLNARNLLMPLRKICNHPYLLEYPLDPTTGEYRMDEDLVKVCGKLQVLDYMLPALQKQGHKVLLFSQMTSLLNIIEDYCYLRHYTFVRLDGSTKWDERQELINDFNNNPEVFLFLLSTRAGGLGINLTSADTVIIYDSDWNPQCDLQAQDRCHRFGQTKPVVVYRLVTANTIDERIVIRAAAKRKLEKMIMQKGRFSKASTSTNSSSPFTVEELKELLKSSDHAGVVRTNQGQLFTPEQLELLLSRKDLLDPSGTTSSELCDGQEGLFKVLGHDLDGTTKDSSLF